MSGGVPKRVLISKTQSNTPSKSGRWGKPGIILCSGARSRRSMCNYVMRRTNRHTTPFPSQPRWWVNNPAVLAAISLLSSYFASQGLIFALIGNSETIEADLGVSFPESSDAHLNHYYMGMATSKYSDLIATRPDLKAPIDLINSIRLQLQVRISGEWVHMIHVVGAITSAAQTAFEGTEFGAPIDFGANTSVMSYGYNSPCLDASTDALQETTNVPIFNEDQTNCSAETVACFLPAGADVRTIDTIQVLPNPFGGGCITWGTVCNCCDGAKTIFYVEKNNIKYEVDRSEGGGWYTVTQEPYSGPFSPTFTGGC